MAIRAAGDEKLAMSAPRRDHYLAPRADEASRRAIDLAVSSLLEVRRLHRSDPTLHGLASLAAELEGRMAPAVADARHYGCSWAEVADLLGVTRASAWQRYGRTEKAVNDAMPRRPVR
jgi:hypothetical protein